MKKVLSASSLLWCAFLFTAGGTLAMALLGWEKAAVVNFVARTVYLFTFTIFAILLYGKEPNE